MAMQSVSLQLLKPPKDLASWNFPLSQILEEYFNLLPEPCKIHYGEAALVIQNSVNAYVRRVEELYDETRFFSKKMTVNSKENGAYSDKEKKQKKGLLGIGQFEPIDFDKEKGKSINLKGQDKKTFKLLHGCFSQLENYHSKVSIEVFDIQGEIIGKKYSFRCNNHMTQSGILVDEFTEEDFNFSKPIEERRIDSSKSPQNINNNRNELNFIFSNIANIHESTNNTVEEPLPADIQDDASDNESEGNFSDALNTMPIHLEPEVINEMDTTALDSSGADSTEFFENENITEEHNNDITSNESFNTCSEVSNEINSSATNLENNENEPILDSNNEESIAEEHVLDSNNKKSIENEHTLDSNNEENIKNKTESARIDINSETGQDKSSTTAEDKLSTTAEDKISATAEDKISATADSNSTKRSRSDANDKAEDCGRQLRSKKAKEMNEKESSSNNNVNLLQPIPFEDGIPKKTMKSRKEFRLPCHINLLKRKTYKRKSAKGKKTEDKRSKEVKKKAHVETSDLTSTTCSSIPPVLEMKKEDHEEFQKLYEETISRHSQSVHYEPVTTLTMDLLGFHPTYNNNDSLSERSPRLPFTSDTHSPRCLSPASTTYSADIAMSPPPGPAMSNVDEGEQHQQKSADNMGRAIKDKIKKIYEELDILTDEDHKIAKWHEEIKPRLEEAERKPPFRIQDYESRILKKLETRERKLNFEEIIREEPASEVARYFSATLQLASTNSLNINPTNNLNHSIELILVE